MKGEPKRQAPECSALHKLFSPFFLLSPLLLLLSFAVSLSIPSSMLRCFIVFVQGVWGKGQVERKLKTWLVHFLLLLHCKGCFKFVSALYHLFFSPS